MSSAIKFIPYGVIVDEFQHRIYENPDMSPDERKQVFRDLEKKYLPHRDYRDIDILEKGCYWFKQGHIFKNPFFTISKIYLIKKHIISFIYQPSTKSIMKHLVG